MKAKLISKIYKAIVPIGIIICHVLKWLGIFDVSSGEICLMWSVIYGLGAGTIDINLMLEKFGGIKCKSTQSSE